MVALLSEKRLSLNQLAKREGVHVSTIWRWINRGVRGIKLATIEVGGRSFVTDSLYEKFVMETTAAKRGEIVEPIEARRLGAEHAAAESELAAELD
jgi:transposase